MKDLIGKADKPVATYEIKVASTDNNDRSVKLWRAVFGYGINKYVYYFLDVRFDGCLVDRQVYDSFEEAIGKWYAITTRANNSGYFLTRRN